jgi:hypothetical protein|nr:MAG TPA: hypothetical protein [Crassvirales sp.]
MKKEIEIDPKWLIIAFIMMIMLLFTKNVFGQTKTTVKPDTVLCKTECIVKYVQTESKSGKVKTYAVYKDEKNGIEELIPISQTVLDYVKLCGQNNLKPTLGIKVKNGQIVSLIRYKPRLIRK